MSCCSLACHQVNDLHRHIHLHTNIHASGCHSTMHQNGCGNRCLLTVLDGCCDVCSYCKEHAISRYQHMRLAYEAPAVSCAKACTPQQVAQDNPCPALKSVTGKDVVHVSSGSVCCTVRIHTSATATQTWQTHMQAAYLHKVASYVQDWLRP